MLNLVRRENKAVISLPRILLVGSMKNETAHSYLIMYIDVYSEPSIVRAACVKHEFNRRPLIYHVSI